SPRPAPLRARVGFLKFPCRKRNPWKDRRWRCCASSERTPMRFGRPPLAILPALPSPSMDLGCQVLMRLVWCRWWRGRYRSSAWESASIFLMKIKALIVDDEPLGRERLRKLLAAQPEIE